MDQSRDVQQRIDRLVERAQSEVLSASRRLAAGITKETERFVPPVSQDIERVVDEVFDFAQRVMKGQRKMVRKLKQGQLDWRHGMSKWHQKSVRILKLQWPRFTIKFKKTCWSQVHSTLLRQ
jgi:dissimilatory sulfite reductase (desulfoviridin) alpha/beta subunit